MSQDTIIKSVKDAIGHTHSGMTPNEALEKVARDNKLAPEQVRRCVEAFNKSKAVHTLSHEKQASRAADFDIGDASAIIAKIWGVSKEARAGTMPALIDFNAYKSKPVMEKTASTAVQADPSIQAPKTKERVDLDCRLAYKQHLLYKHAAEQLQNTVAVSEAQLRRALDKLAFTLRPLQEHELHKFAQTMVNALTREQAASFLRLTEQWTGRKLPQGLTKTARAVIFTSEPQYLSAQSVLDYATILKFNIDTKKLALEKEAGIFEMPLEAAGEGTNMFASAVDTYSSGSADANKLLDASFQARRREIEARNAIGELLTLDPEISRYKPRDVVKAYNETVSTLPESISNRGVLRNMILRNIQTGGVSDPSDLKTQLDIAKNLGFSTTQRRAELDSSKETTSGPGPEATARTKIEVGGPKSTTKDDNSKKDAKETAEKLKAVSEKANRLIGLNQARRAETVAQLAVLQQAGVIDQAKVDDILKAINGATPAATP